MTPEIQMNPVNSSNINALGYDEGSKTLRVAFNNGSEYDYSGVPEDIFATLSRAESVGRAFYALVRSGGFKYERRC